MDEDLKEALEEIATLRAVLQLAYFDKQEITAKRVREALRDSRKVLKKNGLEHRAHDYESK